jgi:hypothetical protein
VTDKSATTIAAASSYSTSGRSLGRTSRYAASGETPVLVQLHHRQRDDRLDDRQPEQR